jgi:hypothetical protein
MQTFLFWLEKKGHNSKHDKNVYKDSPSNLGPSTHVEATDDVTGP